MFEIIYLKNPPNLIGAAPGGNPYVAIFDIGMLALKKRFLAYDSALLGAINVSAGDLKGDCVEEIAVGSNSAEAHVTVWSAKSGELLNSFCASGQNDGGIAFKGGGSVPTYVESFYVAPVDDTRGVKVG
jgi:hypothetical protein